MVKHNNMISKGHYHKDWAKFVKTWFNQPAKKKKRRERREERAKLLAPRPLHLLHPIVRCPTIKYNTRVRAGRGFSLEEIKAAGIPKKDALNIGISIDHRRHNKCDESFQLNVQRLKSYRAKLILFPRTDIRHSNKKESTEEERKMAEQKDIKEVFPITIPSSRIKAREITQEEKQIDPSNAYPTVTRYRQNLMEEKKWGKRERRAKEKAEKAKAAAKKVSKKGKD